MDNDINESVKIETSEVEKKIEKVTTETKPVHQRDRKHGKEEKPRKKEERGVEQIMKSLNSIDNVDEKLSAICKKYSEVIDENRKLQLALKQSEKKVQMTLREKEQLQAERSKAVLTRSRLESLCRELQRQNKAVKEESLLKLREEEEKRKEVSAKFQSTLAEITALMSQNNDKNAKLHEDNMEMSKNFKSVCEQVELREQQFEKINQQMKLEIQLAEAKLAKVTLEMTADKETLLNEKKLLLSKLTEYQLRIKEMQAQEVGLRSQISMYTEKYDEFQNALTKSNKVFGGFNEEMEKMSKKIQKLEKETGLWKQRWEKSHHSLLEMAADKQARDAEIEGLNRKRSQLIELCKAFQQERTVLMAELKAKNLGLDSAQNESNENMKPVEQINNLPESSEELSNSLSQAQESLVQDVTSHEERKKGLHIKPRVEERPKKVEEPPNKAEPTKRKEKKKHEMKQKTNGNVVVKKELEEKGKEVALKEKGSEKESSPEKHKSLEEDKKVADENKISIEMPSNQPETLKENSKAVDENEELGGKNEETTDKVEEVAEKKSQEIIEQDTKQPEMQNILEESKSKDNLNKSLEPLDSKEKLEETCVSNFDKGTNQIEAGENVKGEINGEIAEITKQVQQLYADWDGDIVEKKNLESNPDTILADQEDVQIKSDACSISGKKGKEAKRKKK